MNHIERAETKSRRKLAILRKLSGTTWGANERILKNVYQQGIRPHLEYGSTAFSAASDTTLQRLDKVQNQALRIITGGMKSTPIQEMEKITGIQPLQERRDTKVMIQGEKFLAMESHPMKARFQELALGRLKRSSFIHQAKRMRRTLLDLPSTTLPVTPIPQYTPWEMEIGPQVDIQTDIPGVHNREQQDKKGRRDATQKLIDDKYPQDFWIRIYTDGSALDAVKKGGAGVVIQYPYNRCKDTISIPTGDYCNNYESEVKAISVAAEKLLTITDNSYSAVILTDAKSVLEALENRKLPSLLCTLAKIRKHRRLVLQWIPAHCGISGNEEADQLAKSGSAMEQPEVPVTFQQKKTMIKVLRNPEKIKDDYHFLGRNDQVTIFRLRTGHNRLRHHMYTKFRIGDTSTCICGHAPQTTEHILQHCTKFQNIRDKFWEGDITLDTKLYGSLEELQKTALFIQDTLLQI
jgi:ribonuclease HI